MVRLELTPTCVSDEFADVTAAAFTARPPSPENPIAKSGEKHPEFRDGRIHSWLLSVRYRPARKPPAASNLSVDDRGNRLDQPQKATSSMYVATERSEGGSRSSLRSLGTALRAREGEAA